MKRWVLVVFEPDGEIDRVLIFVDEREAGRWLESSLRCKRRATLATAWVMESKGTRFSRVDELEGRLERIRQAVQLSRPLEFYRLRSVLDAIGRVVDVGLHNGHSAPQLKGHQDGQD